jgi:hypothetical protein
VSVLFGCSTSNFKVLIMKLEFTQTARYQAAEVADKPGVHRFAFSEPLLSDKVPLYLVLLMALGYWDFNVI